jgi:hypothetical protein
VQKQTHPLVALAVLALAGWLILGDGQGCSLPIISPAKVTAVTYVHDEKAAIPSPVLAALAELNTKGIVATAFPDDTTDGDNQVPDQYRVTLPAAKAVGIPSLVVQAGDKVLRTIKSPTAKAAVLEAAK